MRKEDRVRLPPPLQLELPPGFMVKTRPGGYSVYLRYRIGVGWGEDLVCAVDLGEVPRMKEWIEGQVKAVVKKLASPEGWRGIHLIQPAKGV